MTTPRRACIKSDVLKLDGVSFLQWLQDPNHLYIAGNLSKYGKKQGLTDSKWFKDVKELQKFGSYEQDEDFSTVYEQCIRSTPELWNDLNCLENKILGCWCKLSQACHADILIKLYNEKKMNELQNMTTECSQTKSCLCSYHTCGTTKSCTSRRNRNAKYECPYCHYAPTRKWNLKKHLLNVHKLPITMVNIKMELQEPTIY